MSGTKSYSLTRVFSRTGNQFQAAQVGSAQAHAALTARRSDRARAPLGVMGRAVVSICDLALDDLEKGWINRNVVARPQLPHHPAQAPTAGACVRSPLRPWMIQFDSSILEKWRELEVI